MPFEIPSSSTYTVPFWIPTSNGTSPDTGASGDSLVLYAAGSGSTFVPDLQLGAVHAAAGQYRAVLTPSHTSQIGALWGYHTQGDFQLPLFMLDIRNGSASTFDPSAHSVGLKAVTHSGATVGVGGIAPATYSGVTVGVNSSSITLNANVVQIEGSDPTDQIRDAVVNDATRIDASALNAATGTTIPGMDTKLDTIDNFLDTEIAAILEDTGTTLDNFLDTEIAAILADTNELQTDLADGGRLDLLIDAIKAKTDSLTFTVAGEVNSNTRYIAGTQLTGTGTNGDEWGPA